MTSILLHHSLCVMTIPSLPLLKAKKPYTTNSKRNKLQRELQNLQSSTWYDKLSTYEGFKAAKWSSSLGMFVAWVPKRNMTWLRGYYHNKTQVLFFFRKPNLIILIPFSVSPFKALCLLVGRWLMWLIPRLVSLFYGMHQISLFLRLYSAFILYLSIYLWLLFFLFWLSTI